MNKIYKIILENIVSIKRNYKTIMLAITDFFIGVLAHLFVIYSISQNSIQYAYFVVGIPVVSQVTLLIFGEYHKSVRHMLLLDYYRIGVLTILSGVSIYSILVFFNGSYPLIALIFGVLTSINGQVFLRLSLRRLLTSSVSEDKKTVVFLGLSQNTIAISHALFSHRVLKPIAYVDLEDSSDIMTLFGCPVLKFNQLASCIEEMKIDFLFIDENELSSYQTRELIELCANKQIQIKTMPSIENLMLRDNEPENLENLNLQKFLNRPPVDSQISNGAKSFFNKKIILVTGGGGSIGAEVCMQVALASPKKLIILDSCEYNCFSILQRLRADYPSLEIQVAMMDVKDPLKGIFETNKIDVVFHAAALKHVPLVEENIKSAVTTNIFGTLNLLKTSIEYNVDNFLLVSTDKAVRPTNLMGATKRIAELVCQAYASCPEVKTKINSVRFGNVLGSSGSVIPTFYNQIKSGGPITVTHPEITRYFMTIPEAVTLILEACRMGSDGKVFLLEMGKPIKILDLAKMMIVSSGYKVRNESEDLPNSVEINFTGLRPGEKLHEELLIGDNAENTQHPKIFCAFEEYLSLDQIQIDLAELENLCRDGTDSEITRKIRKMPTGYRKEKNFKKIANKNHFSQTSSPIHPEEINPKLIFEAKKESKLISIFQSLLHKYFLFSRPLTAGVRLVVINKNSQILAVKHPYTDGWNLPGGGIEVGESALDAVVKELKEEVNLEIITSPKLFGYGYNSGVSKRDHVLFFQCEVNSNVKPRKNSSEISEIAFWDVNNLPPDFDNLSREVLEKNLIKANIHMV